MIGKRIAIALIVSISAFTGCRMCDTCYPQGGVIGRSGCANGKCAAGRAGSRLAETTRTADEAPPPDEALLPREALSESDE